MSEPARFAEETAVERIDDDRWRGQLSPRWSILTGGPGGGYLLAIGARAMAAAAGMPDPVSITGHFVHAPDDDAEVEVRCELSRRGRRHATVAATMTAGGRECVRLLGTFSDLSRATGTTRMLAGPPALPAREELPNMDQLFEEHGEDAAFPPPPVVQRFEHRMAVEQMGWVWGEPTGDGAIGGWARLAGGEPMDPFAVLVLADVYPPAVFNVPVRIGWVPTIELTVQLRRRPRPDAWLANRFTSLHTANGYLEEDGEIWDGDDLVALSRQLALAPRGG